MKLDVSTNGSIHIGSVQRGFPSVPPTDGPARLRAAAAARPCPRLVHRLDAGAVPEDPRPGTAAFEERLSAGEGLLEPRLLARRTFSKEDFCDC